MRRDAQLASQGMFCWHPRDVVFDEAAHDSSDCWNVPWTMPVSWSTPVGWQPDKVGGDPPQSRQVAIRRSSCSAELESPAGPRPPPGTRETSPVSRH